MRGAGARKSTDTGPLRSTNPPPAERGGRPRSCMGTRQRRRSPPGHATCTWRIRPRSGTWCPGPRPRIRHLQGAWGAAQPYPPRPAPPRSPVLGPDCAQAPPPGDQGAAQRPGAAAGGRQDDRRSRFARSRARPALEPQPCALARRARCPLQHRSPGAAASPPPAPAHGEGQPPAAWSLAPLQRPCRHPPAAAEDSPPPLPHSTPPPARPPAAGARAGTPRCTGPRPRQAAPTAGGSGNGSLPRLQPQSSPV